MMDGRPMEHGHPISSPEPSGKEKKRLKEAKEKKDKGIKEVFTD